MFVGHVVIQAVGDPVTGFEIQAKLIHIFNLVGVYGTESFGPRVNVGIVAIACPTNMVVKTVVFTYEIDKVNAGGANRSDHEIAGKSGITIENPHKTGDAPFGHSFVDNIGGTQAGLRTGVGGVFDHNPQGAPTDPFIVLQLSKQGSV